MRRILYAIILSLLAVPAYAQQWDQVNGSMQVRSGPSTPLVIIDQTNATANSKILSLRAAGTEKCWFDIDGDMNCAGSFSLSGPLLLGDGTAAAPSYSFSSSGNSDNGMFLSAANVLGFSAAGTERVTISASAVTSTVPFVFSGGSTLDGITTANTIDQRNGTTAQSFRIYKTFTDASNYERLALQSDANVFYVTYENAGTGAAKALQLSAPTTKQVSLNVGGVSVKVGDGGDAAAGLTSSSGVTFVSRAVSGTAPTIASGGCTSPTITEANGTAAFTVTVGTTCATVKTVTLTMPAADNLWACRGENNTSDAAQATNYIVARATSTTAVVLTSYDRVTGLQEDFTDSDVYLVACVGSGS